VLLLTASPQVSGEDPPMTDTIPVIVNAIWTAVIALVVILQGKRLKKLRAESLEYDLQRKDAIVEIEDFAKELRDAYARIQAAHDLIDTIAGEGSPPTSRALRDIQRAIGFDGVKLKETP